MATKQGKTPMFPGYPLREYPQRNLFVLQGKTIISQRGMVFVVGDFAELVAFLFDHNALLFVESLSSIILFPFLFDAVMDPGCKVVCTKIGEPTAVICRRKNLIRKIVSSRAWGDITDEEIGTAFLHKQVRLYEYCKVGVHATPGALGKALVLDSWQRYHLDRHIAPNIMCNQFLWDHHFGGRCDLMVARNSEYDEVIELDMSSAYLAHHLFLPTSTSHSVVRNACWDYPTFYVACEVEVTHELPLGPFPVRHDRSKLIHYPVKPGTYRTHLWREQIEDCLHYGFHVKPLHGYAWKSITHDTAPWCQDTYALRMRAPEKEIENDIKKLIVSAIGRYGMHGDFYSLVDASKADSTDLILHDERLDRSLPFFIHHETDGTSAAMTHWFSYTIMQTARSLFHYSYPYAESGKLIMTNYDALLVEATDEEKKYPEKHTLAAMMVEMGDLRWQRLTHVKILAPRSLECDQTVKRPGVKRGA